MVRPVSFSFNEEQLREAIAIIKRSFEEMAEG